MPDDSGLPFTSTEYRRRHETVTDRMADEGLDVLVVADTANVNYLSGYDAYSFYTPMFLVVTPDRPQPIWVGRGCDIGCALETTWLDDEYIDVFSDEYVDSEKHSSAYVADILSGLGHDTGTVGVEMQADYFTGAGYVQLERSLPDATIADASYLVNRVRMRKSDQEVAYHREAGRITGNAMEAALERIEPGVRECDVAADVYHALISGTDDHAGEYPAIAPLMNVGDRSIGPHFTPGPDTIAEGEPILMEWAGVVNRYHAPIARTAVIGDPPEELERAAEIIVEGLETALAAVEPGVTCEKVELAWREVTEGTMIEKETRIGYSTGIGYPPNWVEKSAHLRPGDETVLEPNMVFHMIPGYWSQDDGFGVEISESFVVTPDGAETLVDVPHDLIVL